MEETGRGIRNKAAKAAVNTAKNLGKVAAYVRPKSIKMESFVEDVGDKGKASVRNETKLEKNVRAGVDKVHDIKDSVTKSKNTAKRNSSDLSKIGEVERDSIKSGKYDRATGSKVANKISRTIRVASTYKNEAVGKGKVILTTPKAVAMRLRDALLNGKREGKSADAYAAENKSFFSSKKEIESSSKTADKFDKAAERVEGFGRTVMELLLQLVVSFRELETVKIKLYKKLKI